MRIIIDMQGAQTASRFRGIGRYTLSFVQSVVRNRGSHEVILVLSGLFPDSIESICASFLDILPSQNIKVWKAPGPVCGESNPRYEVAELIREHFICSLLPDVVIVSSLFEGYGDDAVVSIGKMDKLTPTCLILYDLIPYLNPEQYLAPNPGYKKFYMNKIEYVKRAELCFAISNFSKNEAVENLNLDKEKVVSILAAVDDIFQPRLIDEGVLNKLLANFNICRKFILYAGGADKRKNLGRLLEAYSILPQYLCDEYNLVFAGFMSINDVAELKNIAKSFGINSDNLKFTGYIDEDSLVNLYNASSLYIFPSWHEGFGLPALEAMSCGVPVIAANSSSLPEVVGLDEALFDPFDVISMADKIKEVLQDNNFAKRLALHGISQAKRFSWDQTAARAILAIESLINEDKSDREKILNSLIAVIANKMVNAKDEEILAVSDCLAFNEMQVS
jgi:glycosyltransferase involved in cell wall biosynthesis